MKTNRVKSKILLLMITSIFLFCACQSLPLQAPEEALEKRVAGMMEARVNGNWIKVYEYLDPEYKKNVTKNEFISTDRNISYSDFSIESVRISSEKQAEVFVKYDMTVLSFEVPGHKKTQNWVKHRGKWYFKMDTDTGMGLKN